MDHATPAKLLRAKPDREGSSEKFLIKSVERSWRI